SFDAPLRRDARIVIYTAGGQRIQTAVIRAGETTAAVRLNGKTGDIRAVQVCGDTPAHTGSTLIRTE
ncbi:MAG: hypothetical protein LUC22_07075, partial [Prevotella sp.]|nr:hypothetical protein [Prevotella sp.]